MADLFERDVKTIGKHINNALREELDNSVVANFATTASDGKTYYVEHYSLDMIISRKEFPLVHSFWGFPEIMNRCPHSIGFPGNFGKSCEKY